MAKVSNERPHRERRSRIRLSDLERIAKQVYQKALKDSPLIFCSEGCGYPVKQPGPCGECGK